MHDKSFNIIECAGTPYDIGRQWGEACREHLHECFEVNIGAITAGYGVTPADAAVTALKLVPLIESFDPDYLELVKGQAEGAGLTFDEMFTLRCTLELAPYYQQLSGLCTSFAARGAATADGSTILGQNIDWLPTFPLDLLRIRYKNGPTLLSLSLGGIVEYSLSNRGFGMCANSLFTKPDNIHLNIPISCYLFKAMRQDSAPQAFNVLRQTARGMAYFHLAAADGYMVGIESDFHSHQKIEPEKDLLLHTNSYQSACYQAADMAPAVLPDAFPRRERMQKLLDEAHGKITPETMMQILADHEGHPHGICRHVPQTPPGPVPQTRTLASFIMDLQEEAMYIARGNPCRAEYIRYRLD